MPRGGIGLSWLLHETSPNPGPLCYFRAQLKSGYPNPTHFINFSAAELVLRLAPPGESWCPVRTPEEIQGLEGPLLRCESWDDESAAPREPPAPFAQRYDAALHAVVVTLACVPAPTARFFFMPLARVMDPEYCKRCASFGVSFSPPPAAAAPLEGGGAA